MSKSNSNNKSNSTRSNPAKSSGPKTYSEQRSQSNSGCGKADPASRMTSSGDNPRPPRD